MPKRKTKTVKKGAARTGEAMVKITIDRALKAAWNRAQAELEATRMDGARAWDRFWETVGTVIDHDPPLYLAGGVSTEREFYAKFADGIDERAARRNVRVAKVASPDEEALYTVQKLDEALTYLEAKMGGPPKGRVPVDFAKLRIPVEGRPGGLPLADATVQQIRAATRALHPKHAGKTSPVVAEIARVLGSVKFGKDIGVHYANGFVSLTKIPAHAFRDVMRALAKANIPTPERK